MQVYRDNFQPSAQLERPYAMAGVSVFAADSDEEGAFLATSMQQQFVNLRRGRPGPLPPPVERMDGIWSPLQAEGVGQAMKYACLFYPSDAAED